MALAAPGRLRRGMVGAGLRRLVDLALPNRCAGCRAVIGSDGVLCPACFARLDFITAPQCSRCGLPLPVDPQMPHGDGPICGGCLADPPRFGRARAALVYRGLARDIVLMLKHADRTDLVRPLARWLERAAGPLLAEADLLVPVPLHRSRLAMRRFNQAALLAQALGAAAHVPVAVDLLRRVRATPSQGHLSAAQRRRNVRGAFVVRPHDAARIAGARILLVDDVMTTGATLDACTLALTKAGAAAVDALAVARVMRADPTIDPATDPLSDPDAESDLELPPSVRI